MKRKRILGEGEVHCHCMSRIVGGEPLLGEREKEMLRGMLWRVAEFCGVRVLTYAVMSNHFHVLVHVPSRAPVGDGELVRRYTVLYEGNRSPWQPKPAVLAMLLEENGREGRLWRSRLLARMGDVSAFMKTLKQRFSLWYNRTHGRYGTLWAGRFKSVWIEGDPRALMIVAAYIDLNPVRAGLVEDPAAYRWCGYAEAMGGAGRARRGLAALYGEDEDDEGDDEGDGEGDGVDSWAGVVSRYRSLIYGVGTGGAVGKGKISREEALRVIGEGGEVSRAEALRCRVRYFTEGAVLGSAAFVEAHGEAHRARSGRRRKVVPSPMAGASWEGLTVLRGMRRAVFA
jgi:putative transposase